MEYSRGVPKKALERAGKAGKKTGTDDSTVVDAEFEEVDPDKKR